MRGPGTRFHKPARCVHVFGQEVFLVEAEEMGDRANEPAIEYASGQAVPLFILESFEVASPDAGSGGDFVQGHAAEFPFAPEMLAEAVLGRCRSVLFVHLKRGLLAI